MIDKYILLMLTTSLILLSCKVSDKAEDDMLDNLGSFQEIEVLESFNLEEFSDGELLSMNTNINGIFLLLTRPTEIVHLSKDFKFINKYNQIGPGPGELMQPWKMAVSDDNIFVADKEKMSIEIFDTNFNYIQSISLRSLPLSIDVYPNEYIVVSFAELGQSKLEVYDSKLLKSIVLLAETDEALDIVGKAIFKDNGNVIFSRTYINQIFEIEIFDNITKESRIKIFPERVESTKKMDVLMPDYSLVADIISKRNFVFVLSGISSKEDGQPIIKFNDDMQIDKVFRSKSKVSMIDFLNDSLIGFDPTERKIYLFNSIL